MMPSFALLSALVTLGALFSFLSYRVLRLPSSIGTMLLSLAAACVLIVGGHAVPEFRASAQVVVAGIDFNQVVLHGMLAFLLFAGALQLDLKELGRERVSVLSLSIFATALSTVHRRISVQGWSARGGHSDQHGGSAAVWRIDFAYRSDCCVGYAAACGRTGRTEGSTCGRVAVQ